MQTVAWVIFLFGSGFVLYALAGYPLLLWVLARRPKPAIKRFEPRSVTILLPVHNGEQWVRQKLQSIFDLDYPSEKLQILVISDGSTDRTEQIAGEFSSRGVKVIQVPKGGKALALNAGLSLATGEILFFTDVRQRLEPECLRSLVACFADPATGGVCGELVILDGHTQEEASVGVYWKYEKWIRRQLSAMGTLLVVTGCLYAIRRNLAEPLPHDALGDDIFMPQAVLRKGQRVVFEEGAKAYDYPTARDVEFRRKVRTLAALYQYIGQHGFGPHSFHFFSYKVSRLLLPYALIAVFVSSWFLTPPLAWMLVAAQLVFYVMALADTWVSEGTLLKRVSSVARTFCMLMVASLWAVSVLFVPASDLWKTTHVRAARPDRA